MTAIRAIERLFEVVDWIAVVLLSIYAGMALLLGVFFGLFALGNPGSGEAVLWSLAMGIAYGIAATVTLLAALAMRRRHPWRWWLQLATLPVYFVSTTAALCQAPDVSVRVGSWTVCGN